MISAHLQGGSNMTGTICV